MLSENDLNNKYCYDTKKKIAYKIQKIKSKKNYIKLFKIISNNNEQYSVNKNGIFFNLNSLKIETLFQLESFLDQLENKLVNSDNISSTTFDTIENIITSEENDYEEIILSNIEKNTIKKI
tara:strand:+ start:44 stop:406 length:363 start_codon:yes stop_codon:yes gene_type:complete